MRLATDCLTAQGLYQDAMDEYDQARIDAATLEDSVLAVVDWLAVLELATGNHTDAVGGSVPSRMKSALDLLQHNSATTSHDLPVKFAVAEAYPNPFNSTTTIKYSLPEAGHVKVAVYDMAGRVVSELVNGDRAAGEMTTSWNGSGAAAGVYFCRVEAGDKVGVTKLLLVK